uniref:Uncharacterized protein n=1 Tax=Chromera velia CCMP2878 TaxID=1169474 RepID=A0A0K6S6J6_9ALVE|eukprot:Cvel_16627.t2-p1 / transcript=Cvel_16627.t2 / gene=Cvel_16627 / organism=Chromera_velia_CCMP2878 / gene_product=Lecithin-cholesterol acyltransferase-like 4, putative / transcript_product=Lecithin-cholesterol acyltransferase-like 4, putative / location=Cvel_scaffold1289:456-12184(-) / protein_length=2173 / sequence_SO=supercontig / SO=protein_coding / is_pseudo=false
MRPLLLLSLFLHLLADPAGGTDYVSGRRADDGGTLSHLWDFIGLGGSSAHPKKEVEAVEESAARKVLEIFNLTWTQTEGRPKRPLILIPGQTFSPQVNETDTGKVSQIWLRLMHAEKVGLGSMLLLHGVGNFDPEKGWVQSAVRTEKLFTPLRHFGLFAMSNLFPDSWVTFRSVDYFQKTIEHLESKGYQRGVTLFGFPYDWRQSVRAPKTMRRLRRLIRTLGKGGKVDILSHSMGGLVTKALILQCPKFADRNIANWVTVASPFAGAAAGGLIPFIRGDNWGNPLLSLEAARAFEIASPAAYELQPDFNFSGWTFPPGQNRIGEGRENGTAPVSEQAGGKEEEEVLDGGSKSLRNPFLVISNRTLSMSLDSYESLRDFLDRHGGNLSEVTTANGDTLMVGFNPEIWRWAMETKRLLGTSLGDRQEGTETEGQTAPVELIPRQRQRQRRALAASEEGQASVAPVSPQQRASTNRTEISAGTGKGTGVEGGKNAGTGTGVEEGKYALQQRQDALQQRQKNLRKPRGKERKRDKQKQTPPTIHPEEGERLPAGHVNQTNSSTVTLLPDDSSQNDVNTSAPPPVKEEEVNSTLTDRLWDFLWPWSSSQHYEPNSSFPEAGATPDNLTDLTPGNSTQNGSSPLTSSKLHDLFGFLAEQLGLSDSHPALANPNLTEEAVAAAAEAAAADEREEAQAQAKAQEEERSDEFAAAFRLPWMEEEDEQISPNLASSSSNKSEDDEALDGFKFFNLYVSSQEPSTPFGIFLRIGGSSDEEEKGLVRGQNGPLSPLESVMDLSVPAEETSLNTWGDGTVTAASATAHKIGGNRLAREVEFSYGGHIDILFEKQLSDIVRHAVGARCRWDGLFLSKELGLFALEENEPGGRGGTRVTSVKSRAAIRGGLSPNGEVMTGVMKLWKDGITPDTFSNETEDTSRESAQRFPLLMFAEDADEGSPSSSSSEQTTEEWELELQWEYEGGDRGSAGSFLDSATSSVEGLGEVCSRLRGEAVLVSRGRDNVTETVEGKTETEREETRVAVEARRVVAGMCRHGDSEPCVVDRGRGKRMCVHGLWSPLCRVESCDTNFELRAFRVEKEKETLMDVGVEAGGPGEAGVNDAASASEQEGWGNSTSGRKNPKRPVRDEVDAPEGYAERAAQRQRDVDREISSATALRDDLLQSLNLTERGEGGPSTANTGERGATALAAAAAAAIEKEHREEEGEKEPAPRIEAERPPQGVEEGQPDKGGGGGRRSLYESTERVCKRSGLLPGQFVCSPPDLDTRRLTSTAQPEASPKETEKIQESAVGEPLVEVSIISETASDPDRHLQGGSLRGSWGGGEEDVREQEEAGAWQERFNRTAELEVLLKAAFDFPFETTEDMEVAGSCVECLAGSQKPEGGPGRCEPCPPLPSHSTWLPGERCGFACAPGYFVGSSSAAGRGTGEGICVPCPVGTFKATSGDSKALCVLCENAKRTAAKLQKRSVFQRLGAAIWHAIAEEGGGGAEGEESGNEQKGGQGLPVSGGVRVGPLVLTDSGVSSSECPARCSVGFVPVRVGIGSGGGGGGGGGDSGEKETEGEAFECVPQRAFLSSLLLSDSVVPGLPPLFILLFLSIALCVLCQCARGVLLLARAGGKGGRDKRVAPLSHKSRKRRESRSRRGQWRDSRKGLGVRERMEYEALGLQEMSSNSDQSSSSGNTNSTRSLSQMSRISQQQLTTRPHKTNHRSSGLISAAQNQHQNTNPRRSSLPASASGTSRRKLRGTLSHDRYRQRQRFSHHHRRSSREGHQRREHDSGGNGHPRGLPAWHGDWGPVPVGLLSPSDGGPPPEDVRVTRGDTRRGSRKSRRTSSLIPPGTASDGSPLTDLERGEGHREEGRGRSFRSVEMRRSESLRPASTGRGMPPSNRPFAWTRGTSQNTAAVSEAERRPDVKGRPRSAATPREVSEGGESDVSSASSSASASAIGRGHGPGKRKPPLPQGTHLRTGSRGGHREEDQSSLSRRLKNAPAGLPSVWHSGDRAGTGRDGRRRPGSPSSPTRRLGASGSSESQQAYAGGRGRERERGRLVYEHRDRGDSVDEGHHSGSSTSAKGRHGNGKKGKPRIITAQASAFMSAAVQSLGFGASLSKAAPALLGASQQNRRGSAGGSQPVVGGSTESLPLFDRHFCDSPHARDRTAGGEGVQRNEEDTR